MRRLYTSESVFIGSSVSRLPWSVIMGFPMSPVSSTFFIASLTARGLDS